MMDAISRESLELLKSKIDLVEVLNPYLKLHRSGASYKALCPFHDEKTPSFIIQRGDSHYHCFGCGAHGDAIQFLMTHLKMGFIDAVQSLAERFHVQLERTGEGIKGPNKAVLKEALEHANRFFQFLLFHTMEGHAALDYLYNRGIDLAFIRTFEFGLAPKSYDLFLKAMWELKISSAVLNDAGLLSKGRPFFTDRITIPIRDAVGAVTGFSARKYKAETFGGKYINSPETVLFKKSKVLFGLSYSRKRIAKTRKALIVEGQIDALRLIHLGFDWAVAGQGTAFTEEMADELIHLGVKTVFLALDGDSAGQEAAVKIGHLFQKQGVEVQVVTMALNSDPDLILMEKGPEVWQNMLGSAQDYLSFLVSHFSKTINFESPAGKNELVQTIAKRIREWDHPLMVHESLRKLARLTQTPETIIGAPTETVPQIFIKQTASVGMTEIDPDRILEADLLRWLFLMGETVPDLIKIAEANLKPEHFRTEAGLILYEKYTRAASQNLPRDMLSLAIDLEKPQQQLFLAEVLQKKVNRDRAIPLFTETVQKILERHWMLMREEIKAKIYSGKLKEEEVLELAKQFDELKKIRPEVNCK